MKLQSKPELSFRKKILFSLFFTLFLFASLDGLLRLFGFSFQPYRGVQAHQNVPEWSDKGVGQDPTLPWSWTPIPGAKVMITVRTGSYSVQFNQKGYRSPEFSISKPQNTIRIVAMGDSCTMGWGVEDSETYSSRLQNLLQGKSDKRVEVINAGVLGHTSFQGVHQLRTRITELTPDVVIISYNWNDHLPAIDMGQGQPVPDKLLPTGNLTGRLASSLADLRSYQLMQYLLWKTTKRTTPETKSTKEQSEELVRVSLTDYEQNLESMMKITREHHIIPVLMNQPRRTTRLPNRPELKKYIVMQAAYNQTMKRVAQRHNRTYIDIQPAFSKEGELEVFLDLVHPTPKGHSLIAEELSKAITELPVW
jgi:lysophospholipase L1-like esterase